MLKIFSKGYNNIGSIKGVQVINNYLYILNDNEMSTYESTDYDNPDNGIFLHKIDLNKRIETLKIKIYIYIPISLIDNEIYCLSDDMIYTMNINTHKIKHIGNVHGSIRSFYKINNRIHYSTDVDELDKYTGEITSKIIVKDLETNETFYTVVLSCNKLEITDEEIRLPFSSCRIYHYHNTFIFYSYDEAGYIKVNFVTKELETILADRIYYIGYRFSSVQFMNDCNVLYEVDGNVVIFDLRSNTYKKFFIEHEVEDSMTFKFNNKRYYIFVHKDHTGELKHTLNIYVNTDDYFKFIDYEKINYDKTMILKNSDEEVEIPFYLLTQRCSLIKSLHDDMYSSSEYVFPLVLNLNNYRNIRLYKRYIDTGDYDDDELNDLFKICDYLQDSDVEYLAEMIIIYVKDSDMNLDGAFKHLELLYTSTCYEQLGALVWIIYNKYNRDDIMYKISDNTLLLNNYIRKTLDIV